MRCIAAIPAGVGSTGDVHLGDRRDGRHAVGRCAMGGRPRLGRPDDLERIEEHGQMRHAKPGVVSDRAKKRQRDEMGTLGSGNHYLEVQMVAEVFDAGDRRGLRARGWRRRRHDPLRLARARPPDRHRLPARHGDRGAAVRASGCPIASSPVRRSSRELGEHTSARCARRSTARSPTARSSRTWCAAVFAELSVPDARSPAVRRVPQHLQGRGARHRRQDAAGSSSTARARRAPSAPGHPDLPEPFAPSASRC